MFTRSRDNSIERESTRINRRGEGRFVLPVEISRALERSLLAPVGQPMKIDTQFKLLIQQDARTRSPTTR